MATVSLGNIVDDVVDSAGDFWNRFQIEVDDLNTSVGQQGLAEDLSGNPVELFQPLVNDPDARRVR